MEGSTLIGTGGGGCVYRPPLCGDRSLDYIGKLVDEKKESTQTELTVTKILREVKDIEKYAILVDLSKWCDVDVTPQIAEKCRDAKKYVGKKMLSYQSKYGGTTLEKYIFDDRPITFRWLYNSFMHLLNGLALFHQHGVYHIDIKGPNIVIDDSGTCKFIDFGIAIYPGKDVAEISFPFYNVFPLFFNAYIGRDGSHDDDDYYNTYEGYMKWFDKGYKRDTIYDWIDHERYRAKKELYLEDVILPNLSKIDAYQLADTMNDLYRKMENIAGGNLSDADKVLSQRIAAMINSMIDPRIDLQSSVEDVLKKFPPLP